jgi:phasin family protein
MFPTQDQISGAAKAGFEAQFAFYASFTGRTLESVEKLISLNLTAAKATMEESAAATRELLAAKDPQEFMTLVNAQARPNFEKALAYTSHLAGIATTTQAEFMKAAEVQISAASQKVNELVDKAAKQAPAGSENMVALVKSALGNVNAGYEQLSKTGKQAAEAIEANLNTAVAQFNHTAQATTAKV